MIEFVDIAGLVKGAHKGEGLGNQFLAHIRNCDALVEVVREFENDKVEHVDGAINPKKDIETVRVELLMKDLETLEAIIQKTEKDKASLKKIELLRKIKDWVSQDKLISELDLTEEEKTEIKEYQFLTEKPLLYVLNTDGKAQPISSIKYLAMNLKDEQDFSELSIEERQELNLKSNLDQLIVDCYNILDLITFFTIAGLKETRAWTLKKGSTAYCAGGAVHSDFQDKFIKAEVISWQKLKESGNWHKARELGWLKTAGKEYLVQDGDVMEFKI